MDGPRRTPAESHGSTVTLPEGEAATPLESLATEFLAAWREGKRPTVDEYASAHPDLATAIRELFPVALALEDLSLSATGRASDILRRGFEPGTQYGHFTIIREIGRGGMGVVYEAVEKSTGRHVALKLVAAPRGTTWREPVLAAKLAHPRIVPIYTSGQQDGLHYYAMMLIQGVGFDRVIKWFRDGATGVTSDDVRRAAAGELLAPLLRPEDAVSGSLLKPKSWLLFAKIGVQIATAVAHAHRRSVLHRDLKPANILLDAQGGVWITDFGLALPTEQPRSTDPYRQGGTLRYMAPEQLEGKADFRADLYAVGATLYELCTQQPAFAGADKAEVAARIRKGEFPRPRQLQPRMPRELERLILRAMALQPQRRFPSADALRAALLRCVQTLSQQSGGPWWWLPWRSGT